MALLKKPFQLGSLTLPSNIFCAPLAGCSDLPFRKMTSAYAPGLVFCEMVKMDALVRHDFSTYRLLDYDRTMHPIGAQLCGSKPHLAAPSARILEDLGFDLIDLNCGCPVDKVTKDKSGSGLLQHLDLLGEIVLALVKAVQIPVTVKIRAGWDDDSIVGPQITAICREAGATALTIHGRTREQGYQGKANWDWIKMCKEVAGDLPIVGNGDLFDAASVEKMFLYTGCDAVLIARGTFGTPWIIEDVYRHLTGEPPLIRSPLNYRDHLLEHLAHVEKYHAPKKAALDLRRIGCWYLKRGQGTKALREALNKAQSVHEIRKLIVEYPWHDTLFDLSTNVEVC